MPRPINTAIIAAIKKAAFQLQREKGFTAMSYSDIAHYCGIAKGLVQHHFPHKELFAIDLVQRIVDETNYLLSKREGHDPRNDIATLYLAEQVCFEFLLQPNGYQAFLTDIVESRELTDSVLPLSTFWNHIITLKGKRSSTNKIMRRVVLATGGFYELLYTCLKNNLPFNAAANLSEVFQSYLREAGMRKSEISSLLEKNQLSADELAGMVGDLNQGMLA